MTSDGKTVGKSFWGALPTGDVEEEESEDEEESSGSEMDESEEEGEEETVTAAGEGIESVLPPPPVAATAPVDLRKQAGDETPMPSAEQPKQLYQVIEQKETGQQQAEVFASEVAYVVPGATTATAAPVPEGAESVLSKALPQNESSKRKRKENDEDDGDLGKNFKF